ncbi:MAG TPA: winged helix-turn-helix domain-containing protein [Thermoanaerobaculia bacterium]|jgi:DNA-binding winged helix-turn-helix (wHTH) protein/TolB-like protein/Tfp pilus assembly protein PilF|nr:winged helix-turn-helix domain-containing protein [Thermoanaerobaculia bacterium]
MNLSHREGTGDTGPPRLLFEGFELRLDSGELLRTGSLVRLQPQPAKILEILASHSGEVVSREEIRRLVWGDSYVDSDASLNFCIKEIRRALGDSATSPTFIETVPRRGYRFLKPVTVAPEAGEPPAEPVPLPPPAPAPPSPRRSRLGTLSVTLALLLLLTLLVASRLGHSPSKPRLAVLPLSCRGQEAADRQVCGGITEALTDELARQFPDDLDVIAPSSVLAYQKKDAAEIGRGLKADYLLSGEAALDRQGLELKVRLSRTDGGKTSREKSFPGELKDAPRLYGQIASEVARQLGLPSSPPKKPTAVGSPSPAYVTYLRGIYLYRHEQFKPAAETLQEAVLLDPGFAPAYAELAQARLKVEPPPDLQATEAAARRARALDPRLAEAHFVLGQILLNRYRDWEGAKYELQTALALDPGNADAHYQYSLYLAALGRHAEALASAERARELDPASMIVGSVYAWYFYLDHQFEEARRQGRDVLQLFPLSSVSAPMEARSGKYYCEDTLLNSAWKLGDHATALEAANEIQKYFTPYREVRDLDEFWHLRELRIEAYLRAQPIDPFARAKNAMALGQPDRALSLLTHQCTPEGMWMPFAAVEPAFDPLHSDPRWGQVLDCLKLPADAPARQARR